MVSLTLRRLKELGYRKIGMLCGAFENRRVEGAIAATIAGYNHDLPATERVPLGILAPHRWNAKYIQTWIERHGSRILSAYALAIREAGKIYRHIESALGKDNFIAEVSTDEAETPQSPLDLFLILGALAGEVVPVVDGGLLK